jgi:hypothetical protein
MDVTARSLLFEPSDEVLRLAEALKDAVNSTIEHELSVGDSEFISDAAKIVLPYDPSNQLIYSVAMGMTPYNARMLALARLGLTTYWKGYLTAVDKDEMVTAADVKSHITVAIADPETKLTVSEKWEKKNLTAPKVTVVRTQEFGVAWAKLDKYWDANNINFQMIFLHMKDVGMLVSANLVKTGHHYQSNTSGAFKAMERKRFGSEVFSNEVRGILYHDAIHCFTQLAKLKIYTDVLTMIDKGQWTGTHALLDPVVKKRIPVVPAGAAWLSAGLTIMNELLAIPKLADKIPASYKTVVQEARDVLTAIVSTAKVDIGKISKFEALAAFAYGVLKEIAPTHSAANAPSLVKIADIHLGARAAGMELGRSSLRGEL